MGGAAGDMAPLVQPRRGTAMVAPLFLAGLLANPTFRTGIAGAGFFADAYDLFITDGVTNMLRSLGPVTKVVYTMDDGRRTNVTSYFTALCTSGVACLPTIYSNATGTWVPNPATVWTPEMTPRYAQQTADNKAAVNNAALIGSILGQLSFGFLGDVLGRKWCFVTTAMLIILGCLGSASAAAGNAGIVPGNLNAAGQWGNTAALPPNSSSDVYLQLTIWRAILGFGVGGEYPLAGTIASEGAATAAARGGAVLWTFSMQGWGKLTAALVNYALISTTRHFGGLWALDGAWRFALGFGCALNIITFMFRWWMEESEIYKAVSEGGGDASAAQGAVVIESSKPAAIAAAVPAVARDWTPLRGGSKGGVSAGAVGGGGKGGEEGGGVTARSTLLALWASRWTLIGTASTWFLIDVTFYGQSLMNTTVVADAIAGSATGAALDAMSKLRASLLSTVWIMLIALPGYWIAIAVVDRVGRKPLQMWGFVAVAVCFVILGGGYDTPFRTSANGAGFIVFYGLTYLFSNAGPNSTTFLVPAEAFPTRARASGHGLSAAFGKVGATVGSFGLLALFYSYCVSQLDSSGAPNCTSAASPSPEQRAETDAGVRAVMFVCAAVAALGAIVTCVFTKETMGVTLEEVDAACEAAGGGGSGGAKAKAKVGKGPVVDASDWGSTEGTFFYSGSLRAQGGASAAHF